MGGKKTWFSRGIQRGVNSECVTWRMGRIRAGKLEKSSTWGRKGVKKRKVGRGRSGTGKLLPGWKHGNKWVGKKYRNYSGRGSTQTGGGKRRGDMNEKKKMKKTRAKVLLC